MVTTRISFRYSEHMKQYLLIMRVVAHTALEEPPQNEVISKALATRCGLQLGVIVVH